MNSIPIQEINLARSTRDPMILKDTGISCGEPPSDTYPGQIGLPCAGDHPVNYQKTIASNQGTAISNLPQKLDRPVVPGVDVLQS